MVQETVLLLKNIQKPIFKTSIQYYSYFHEICNTRNANNILQLKVKHIFSRNFPSVVTQWNKLNKNICTESNCSNLIKIVPNLVILSWCPESLKFAIIFRKSFCFIKYLQKRRNYSSTKATLKHISLIPCITDHLYCVACGIQSTASIVDMEKICLWIEKIIFCLLCNIET